MFAIDIQIAASPHILFELFDTRAIRARMSTELPIGRLRLDSIRLMCSHNGRAIYGTLPTFTFVLTLRNDVNSRMVASWLCDKLQTRPYPLRMAINGIRTKVTVKAVSRAIEKIAPGTASRPHRITILPNSEAAAIQVAWFS